MRVPLAVKVSLLVGILMAGLSVAVYGTASRALSKPLHENLLKKGEALAAQLAANAREAVLNGDELLLGSLIDQVRRESALMYASVQDRTGKVLAHTDLAVTIGSPMAEIAARIVPETPQIRPVESAGRRGHEFAAPLLVRGQVLGVARIALTETEILAAEAEVRNALFLSAGAVLLVGLLSSALLGRLITAPIHRIAEAAQQVGAGNLDARVDLTTRDELGDLAATFNSMTVRLKDAQAAALEQQRLKSEMDVARRIQAALIPKSAPAAKGYEFGAVYRPAREMSGDYYDIFALDERRIAFAVADVCGKGVGAALLMVACRSQVRSEAEADRSPAEVLRRVNRHLSGEAPEDQFITILYGVLDTKRHTLTFANAGHGPLQIVRRGRVDAVGGRCLPLASPWPDMFDKKIADQTVPVEAGALYLVSTDGIIEATDTSKAQFGDARANAFLGSSAGVAPQAILERLLAEVDRFAGAEPQADDMTAVALRRT